MATFGNTTWVTSPGLGICEDAVCGIYEQMGSISGLAQSITINCKITNVAKRFRCAIYDSDDNLVAQTEEKLISDIVYTSTTFNFATPPLLEANAWYYLVGWCENLAGWGLIDAEAVPNNYYFLEVYAANFPAVAGAWLVWTDPGPTYYHMHIYCTYTPVNPLISKPLIGYDIIKKVIIRLIIIIKM